MRFASGMLAMVLFARLAHAENTAAAPAASTAPAEPASAAGSAGADPARGKLPLRVVRVMPESRQALLFDRARGTHVLAEIGAKLDGYTVEDIDDDSVTLSRGGRQVVLQIVPSIASQVAATAPPRDDRAPRPVRAADPAPGDPAGAPIDPYAAPSAGVAEALGGPPPSPAPGPAGEPGIRVVRAPDASTPGDGSVRIAQAPGAAVPASEAAAPAAAGTTAPADPAGAIRTVSASAAPPPAPGVRTVSLQAAPAPRDPVEVAKPPTPGSEVRVAATEPRGAGPEASAGDTLAIPRGEVDRALGDFAALSAGIRASFSAAGVVVDSVGDGTIFQRAGLRGGDVISDVDGQRLRSLDDAANLYARAPGVKALTVHIVRSGRPQALRVVIQ